MRLSLVLLVMLSVLATGCQTLIEGGNYATMGTVPPQTDPEPRTVWLSEMKARLGWESGEAYGARDHAIQSRDGLHRIVFTEGSDVMVMNNLYWRFERNAYFRNDDLLLPESVFDFVARHIGREDLVRARRKPSANYELEPLTPPAQAKKPEKAIGTDLRGWTVCIDAGHGGKDPGGIGHGVSEKHICLNVALRLQKLCEGAGARVIMTRTADTYPELDERVTMANDGKADLFISIHANISPSDDSVVGSEGFYNESSESSKRLTQALVGALVSEVGMANRGAKKDPRGLRVLTKTKMTATLIELGFLSNKAEALRLNRTDTQEKMADALFAGLVKFARAESKASVSR